MTKPDVRKRRAGGGLVLSLYLTAGHDVRAGSERDRCDATDGTRRRPAGGVGWTCVQNARERTERGRGFRTKHDLGHRDGRTRARAPLQTEAVRRLLSAVTVGCSLQSSVGGIGNGPGANSARYHSGPADRLRRSLFYPQTDIFRPGSRRTIKFFHTTTLKRIKEKAIIR